MMTPTPLPLNTASGPARRAAGADGGGAHEVESAGYRTSILVWTALLLALQAIRWVGGFPSGELAVSVEQGVARAEVRAKGEATSEQVRKAIRMQRETLLFWTALAALDDFLLEPALLAVRALLVATFFTGLAALAGRATQYDRALTESAWIQGFWVISLALRLALMVALRRGEVDVETSLAVLLPPGRYSAVLWAFLRQLDVFVLLGWLALARSGWRRGDASRRSAVLLCGGLAALEIGVRAGAELLVGSAMRLTLAI